ncbi:hypothetical protein H0H81_002338, partial [Sphagnurus paluster]
SRPSGENVSKKPNKKLLVADLGTTSAHSRSIKPLLPQLVDPSNHYLRLFDTYNMRGLSGLSLVSLALLLAPQVVLATPRIQYSISNKCSQPINIFVDGGSRGSIDTGSTTVIEQSLDWSGVIYTDANGGSATGAGSTKAGFNGPGSYYYVAAPNPNRLNTGVLIEPYQTAEYYVGFLLHSQSKI